MIERDPGRMVKLQGSEVKKKNGGFEVLGVKSPEQWWKRGEGMCEQVGTSGEKCRLSH